MSVCPTIPWGVVRGAKAFRGVRVGPCADELRLMGVGWDEESSWVADREGGGGSLVQRLCAPRYGADVEWSLGGRCELYYAVCGERWASEGSPV
jgi:hypothetical protein